MTKKTKAPTTKTTKRAKQLGLGEGYERKKIAAIEEAADDLLDAVEERKRLSKQVKELEASLSTLVAEHGLKKYTYTSPDGDEFEVLAENKSRVTVRRRKKAKAKDE